MPRKARPRTSHLYHAPVAEPDATLWDLQREVNVLVRRLANEREALVTWERRLDLRRAYEQTHGGLSQVEALREECAQVHARCLGIQHALAEAQRKVRVLLTAQDG